jgi:hypothetical protein
MSSAGSSCEKSSWLVADFLRLLRPLNILAMRVRWGDEVSLRPSSEARLFSLSSAPSADPRKSSSRLSLLAIETVDDAGPLEGARLPGARLSLLETSCAALTLLARSTAAMVGNVCELCGRCVVIVDARLASSLHAGCGGCARGGVLVRGGEVDYVAGVQNRRDAGELGRRAVIAIMS